MTKIDSKFRKDQWLRNGPTIKLTKIGKPCNKRRLDIIVVGTGTCRCQCCRFW